MSCVRTSQRLTDHGIHKERERARAREGDADIDRQRDIHREKDRERSGLESKDHQFVNYKKTLSMT